MRGDSIANMIFEFTGQILGEALANFVMFSSPEAIVLFGGLTKAGNLLLNPTRKHMELNLLPIFQNKVKLLFSELQESDAAILGASALAWEIFTNEEIARLQQLVVTDRSAKKQFSLWERAATAALRDAPNPIDTITTEGRLQGDPKKVATQNALADMKKMYAFALVYRVKNDTAYLQPAINFLVAWAAKNHPNGDPIDETNLDPAFQCYDLIKEQVPPAYKILIEQWFQQVAMAETKNRRPLVIANGRSNNWNSHRLKIEGEVAWCLNDESLKKYVTENLERHLAANLNADSTSWDLIERDALHYHCYDLQPLTHLAIIIQKNTGVDYYHHETSTGASISKSLDYLIPFVTGERIHPEFVHSRVAFDAARAKNNEPAYVAGNPFKPTEALGVITVAAWYKPELPGLVQKLKNSTERFPDWQSVVNEITRIR
ncbi:alginate lyase-domain-containing protein [Russula earlei]|uniref:Alginate lyase-domain-containing protein n=1 Tax=Russula earlei TaxID=71964 RepID=A0ACC0TU63_9AGAM|nr:alginate lyase-domain-containing protein [Russula earlei]